jgi:uncharacterized spore protein YtfJ
MSDETTAIVSETTDAKPRVKLPKEVQKMLADVGRDTNTDMVFGETRVIGDHALIPVGRVMYSGGGGGGASEATGEGPAGTGSGMGLMVNARPIGVIKITGDRVDWVPTVDVGLLATIGAIVAGALAVLFMVGHNRKLSAKVNHAAPARGGASALVGLASEGVRLLQKARSHTNAA